MSSFIGSDVPARNEGKAAYIHMRIGAAVGKLLRLNFDLYGVVIRCGMSEN